jgi:hypothetical protein
MNIIFYKTCICGKEHLPEFEHGMNGVVTTSKISGRNIIPTIYYMAYINIANQEKKDELIQQIQDTIKYEATENGEKENPYLQTIPQIHEKISQSKEQLLEHYQGYFGYVTKNIRLLLYHIVKLLD